MCEVIYHPDYKTYDLGPDHPFSPLRAEIVFDYLKKQNFLKSPIQPKPLTPEDLLTVHKPSYVNFVEEVSSGKNSNIPQEFGLGSLDNPIVKGMANAARLQCAGTVLGARLLIENKASKVLQLGGGFHHAHKNFASGFCIYNDLALAIKEMTKAGWHVAYLDLDVHHGDGVQEIFYSDEKVMTISIHESGEYLFPGTGWLHELGNGMGRGLKINIPVEPFTEGDSYIQIINTVVADALRWFKPDALLIQAGADAHFSDPLADLMLTTRDFENIYRRVLNLSDLYCNGKILITLGGGYSITATPRVWILLYLILFGIEIPEKIPEDWREEWSTKIKKEFPKFLHDQMLAYQNVPRRTEIEKHNRELIQRIMDAVSPYWI